MTPRGTGSALAQILVAAASLVRAGDISDPFPLRNQLPFDLMFLAPAPGSARLAPRGTVRVSWSAAYENTLVATDDLIDAFAEPKAPYGGAVTLPVLEQFAAASPDGTVFIMDGETLRTAIDLEYTFAPRFQAGVEIPFLLHSGGFMDSLIENWHDAFNLPTGGREVFDRNLFRHGYVGDGETVFFDDAPGGPGLGDIVLSGRAAIVPGPERGPWVTFAGSVKLATGEPDRLGGSGARDYGASILAGGAAGRSTIHGGLGYAWVGPWRLAPGLELRDSRHLFVAWGFAATPGTALVGQVFATRGPFPRRAGGDLGRTSWEIALGLRQRLPHSMQFEAAIIENLTRDFSAPDFGAVMGLRYEHAPSARGASASHPGH